MFHYQLTTTNSISDTDRTAIEGIVGPFILLDVTDSIAANTFRDKVLEVFTTVIGSLRPVGSDKELNQVHPLYHIYTKYITPPTETGMERSTKWFEKIEVFERDIEANQAISQADADFYNLVKRQYPTNLNSISESPITATETKPLRSPALSYEVGAINENQTAAFNVVGETLLIRMKGIAFDKTQQILNLPPHNDWSNPKKTLFRQSWDLSATVVNLVKQMQTQGIPDGDKIGELKTLTTSLPLPSKVSEGKEIQFNVVLNWSYSI